MDHCFGSIDFTCRKIVGKNMGFEPSLFQTDKSFSYDFNLKSPYTSKLGSNSCADCTSSDAISDAYILTYFSIEANKSGVAI